MSIRKVVVGIVFKKGEKHSKIEFLVLHRKLLWTGWEFPKGGVERKDKNLEELALKRELEEETGLTNIRIISKLPYEIRYKYPKKYRGKYKHAETVQSVFLVRAFDDNVKISIEHDDYKWLPYEEARKLITHTNQKNALDVAWKYLKGIGIAD